MKKLVAAALVFASAALAQAPYAYSPVNKRDPFAEPKTPTPAVTCKGAVASGYALDDLKLVALVSGSTRLAMVEDPAGEGYLLKAGMRVGKECAVVTSVGAGVKFDVALGEGHVTRSLALPAEPTR